MTRDANERYQIPILGRALRVLEHLAGAPRPLGASDVAEALGLPRNTAFRILHTLCAFGYVDRDSEKRYRLSRKLLALGHAAVDEHALVERAIDVMRALRDVTGETALIGTLVGDQGVVLEQAPSRQPVKFLIELGHRFPLHTSAPGKALLAAMPADQAQPLIKQLKLTRFTDRTITRRSDLRAELAQAARDGYAVDRGEGMDEVRCVGAPVLSHRGQPIAAIWITAPATRLSTAEIERLGPIVAEHAGRISARFGYQLLNAPAEREPAPTHR